MEIKFDFSLLQKHRDHTDEGSAKFLDHYKGSFASKINYNLRNIPFEEIGSQHQLYIYLLDTIIREQPRSNKKL